MDTKISAEGVNVFYGEAHALKNVSMQFMRNEAVSYTHLTLPTIYSV